MTRTSLADDFIQRNYRWNFLVNLCETSFTLWGRGFIGISTFLPVFISQFSESKIIIGLVGTAIPVGFLIPQLFLVPVVESLAQKKPVVLRLAIGEKLLYVAFTLLALHALRLPAALLVSLFILACFLIGLAGGATQIGWAELMASIFPAHTRGRYFGTAFFVGGLLGALGAYLGGIILRAYHFPDNYALIFFAGFSLSMISCLFLWGIREPPMEVEPIRISSQATFLRGLADLLKKDHLFSTFLWVQSAVILGRMAYGFVAVWGQEKLSLDGYQLGVLSTSLLAGGTFGSLLFGWLGDLYGPRKMLVAGAALQALGLAWATWSARQAGFFGAATLLGLSQAGMSVNVSLLIYEYAPLQRRPTYIGLSSTLFGVVSMAAPVLGGLLSQSFSYRAMFTASGLVSLAAFISYLGFVKEPIRLPVSDSRVV